MTKTIHTQKQFDAIKDNFDGRIEIRDTKEPINIYRSFNNAYIVISDNATIKDVYDNVTIEYVYSNATIEYVSDNATIESVYGNATIKYVYGNATIKYVYGNATIEYVSDNATIKSVYDNATIKSVYDNVTIKSVYDNATIESVYDNVTIKSVSDNATIESVYDNVTIKSVYGNVTIKSVSGNATIESVYDNVTIEYVYSNATIESVYGNVTIKDVSDNATIESVYSNATIFLTGLASITLLYSAKKIVANGMNLIRQIGTKKIDIEKSPSVTFIQVKEDMQEKPSFALYKKLYPIKTTKTKAILYKAVHKANGKYLADYDNSIEYKIGKIISLKCSKDKEESCGQGIHLSHLRWTYTFGRNWEDLAILECETNIEDIVVAKDCDGKVRTSRCKVLREVPKEEYI